MTVNVKKMTVNVTFFSIFSTLSMTEKDHCKRYDEVEYDRKRLPSNSKHCKLTVLSIIKIRLVYVYSGLNYENNVILRFTVV